VQHTKLLSFLVLFAITATLSLTPSFSSAFAQGQDNPGKPEVIAVSGIVPGKNLIVHVLLEVPPGADRNEAAYAALANQGARAFTAEEYSLTGLVWDQFSDSNPGNDSVIQRYNPQNDPTGGNGITALLNTHTTWNDVTTSSFAFEYGGETGKCPSLVQECKGRQTFDGNNDVAWLALRDANTLGVTWSGTSTDEADMALNTNFNWATDGVNHYDVETVFLHENGHVAGIGHSEDGFAIMYPSYQNVNRTLDQDDKDALSALYPGTSTPTNNSPIVSISNPTDNSSFNSATVISFAGSASDAEDGDITSNLSWTSDIDGSIGSGGSFSNILSDGTHTITAEVTDAGGKTSSDSITITVGTPPVTGTTVGVDFITYTGSGGKNDDRHLTVSVNVSDDSGNDVSGATVSITLTNGDSTWTATGTTSSTGSAGFTLKNSPSGTYTTTVTSLVASGLTWDGTTPTNSYTK
jgi:hypothetical protein